MKDNVNILHISDIHFGMESPKAVTLMAHRKNALDEMLRSLSKLEEKDKPDIVVISGDIAWQGKQEAYMLAKDWIINLLSQLNLTSNELVICAGNHDLERGKALGTKPPTNSQEADLWLSIEHLENFARPFSAFENFCEEIRIPKLNIVDDYSNLIGQREIKGINFIVLNSAWFCRGAEDRGNLWIGLPQLEVMHSNSQILHPDEFDKGVISVGVLHHPKDWLHDEEQNTYERPSTYRYLAERTHLILSGHVHAAPENASRIFDRAYVVIGGAAYSGGRYRNNFSILKINKLTRTCDQIPFEFDPRNTKWERKQEKKLFLENRQEGGEIKKKDNEDLDININIFPKIKIPYRTHPFFIGRDNEISVLQDAFHSNLNGVEKILSGLGGIGKTQIAVEFATKFKANYNVIWWIRAENETVLLSDLEELCQELRLPIKDENSQSIIEKVIKVWMQTNQKWLIIFDNANSLDLVYKYLPTSHQGNVLITTRSEVERNSIPIRELPTEKSIEFFLNSTDQKDIESAKVLADELGDLPLALEQASAYIKQTGLTLKEYLSRIQSYKVETIGRGRALNYKDTVLTTWEISLNEVRKKLSISKEFMLFCSFLSPLMISKSIFVYNGELLPQFLKESLNSVFELDDIFTELKNYSLIQTGEGYFSIHPLLQTVIINELNKEEKVFWLEQVIEALERYGRYIVIEHGIDPFVSHLTKTLEHANKLEHVNSSTVSAAARLSKMFMEFGNYDLSLDFGEQALEASKDLNSPELISQSCHNLGVVISKNGDSLKAKEYIEEALLTKNIEIENKINFLNSLAQIELDLGDTKKAESLISEAKQLYDKDSANIKTSDLFRVLLMTSAQISTVRCDFQQAEDSILEYIESIKAEGLEEQPLMAVGYSNLGTALLESGHYERAKKYFKKAIQIYESLFGQNHPKIAHEFDNLGLAYFYNHEFAHAKKYFSKALNLNEKLYPKPLKNIYLAKSYNNYGMALEHHSKDKKKALQYYEKSLEVYRVLFDYDHPTASSPFYNMGNLYKLMGNKDLALENLGKALEIDRKYYGEDHLQTAKDLASLGTVYIEAGQLGIAEKKTLKALKIYEILIPNSLDISMVHLNLSILYIKKLNLTKSRKHIEKSLKIVYENYGLDHNQFKSAFLTYLFFIQLHNLFTREKVFIEMLCKTYNINPL